MIKMLSSFLDRSGLNRLSVKNTSTQTNESMRVNRDTSIQTNESMRVNRDTSTQTNKLVTINGGY